MSNLDRRGFLGALTAGAGLAQAAALEGPLGMAAQRGSRLNGKPKNVLLMMSDQHRHEALGVRGDTVAKTPNLDKLAQSGVCFDHAFCADPVCVPSRASMMTSLYDHHHKTYNNATPWPSEHKTIAHSFGQAGYMTGLIGKMHFVDAQTHGFEYKLDFNDWYQYLGPKTRLRAEEVRYPNSGVGLPQIDDLWRDYGDPWTGNIEVDDREGYTLVGRVSGLAEKDHFEEFVARESIRFLKNFGKKDPFLLVTSFLKPHDPFTPAERFAKMFRAPDMKLPDTWGKVDLSTVPRSVREHIEYNWATPELRDPEKAKRRMASYYASLAQTDDCVGQVLQALKELGLEEDTIVLYTADHGDMLGAHGLWGKGVFYEPSVGVPLLFRVPGMTAANSRCKTPVSHVQVLPTLTELCGIPTPGGIDGTSFVANLREPARTEETTIFAEHNLNTRHPASMIRHGDYKYCYYVGDMPELYNLRTDPDEMKNLALMPAYKEKAQEMQQRLFAWHQPPRTTGA